MPVDEAKPRPRRHRQSSYDEEAPAPKKPERKVTPVFCPGSGELSKTAVLGFDVFGHAKKAQRCDSAEAASHWEARNWHPLRR